MLIFIFYNEKKIEEMTSISKSPVRWRGEGRALALKERGSPSEAFRKPVITDPTYIKRCRQPPATSHQPARSVSSVSLFAFFSPSSLSSSSLYLYRPVRTSFFLSRTLPCSDGFARGKAIFSVYWDRTHEAVCKRRSHDINLRSSSTLETAGGNVKYRLF